MKREDIRGRQVIKRTVKAHAHTHTLDRIFLDNVASFHTYTHYARTFRVFLVPETSSSGALACRHCKMRFQSVGHGSYIRRDVNLCGNLLSDVSKQVRNQVASHHVKTLLCASCRLLPGNTEEGTASTVNLPSKSLAMAAYHFFPALCAAFRILCIASSTFGCGSGSGGG